MKSDDPPAPSPFAVAARSPPDDAKAASTSSSSSALQAPDAVNLKDLGPSEPPAALRVAHCSEQGSRPTMEDEVVLEKHLSVAGHAKSPFALFAVADGHYGSAASAFVHANLVRAVREELQTVADPPQALFSAFLKVDAEFLKQPWAEPEKSGSTLLAALISLRTGELWVANAGDSRAVLCRDAQAVPLSRDHKASRPDEVARIRKAGGFVFQQRVMGELAVSRAIGDADFKEIGAFVIAEPELEARGLGPHDAFLLLACDGLWDVLSNQEAVDFLRAKLAEHNDLERAARELVHHAIHERSSKDNVTVVLVAFHERFA